MDILMKELLKQVPLVRPLYRATKEAFMIPKAYANFRVFKQLLMASQGEKPLSFEMKWSDRWLFLYDQSESIQFEPHYTYHPAWAARVIAKIQPERHVDISSTLGFVTMLSAFVKTDYFEWRPPNLKLSDLSCSHANLLALPFNSDSISSLSCMHVVEHAGLGRYGDPVDIHGDLKAISELKRVLSPGGDLLFVVPIGGQAKILFNAQRTYSYEIVMDAFSDFELVEFALILEDANGMVYNDDARNQVKRQEQGCGCFWFKKPLL
jgi:SAM-dependent methyltransferase